MGQDMDDFMRGMDSALTLDGRIPASVGMALTVAAIVGAFLLFEWWGKRRKG